MRIVRRILQIGASLLAVMGVAQAFEFKQGDTVVLNGWGVGEKHWGGLAEKARVKGDWKAGIRE